MDRTDATTIQPGASFWNPRTGFALVAILTISTCVAVRLLDGLPSATAQREGRVPAQTKSSAPAANVVAVLDGKPFARNDLARECLKRFGEDVLESLVNKSILLDECKRRHVAVTREEVEQEIELMATKFSLPKARWLEMLHEERGISPAQYRADVVWPTLALRKLGAQTLQISDQEIQQAYDSQYGAKVSVRLIAVSQKLKAQNIHQILTQEPDRFARLAMDESEDTNSAAFGGVVPPIRHGMGNVELESAAFALKPGEISQVIPVANQFVIIKCEQHLQPIAVPSKDRKTIRANLETKIRRQREREVAAQTFDRLQEAAKPQLIFNDPQQRQKSPGVAAIVGGKQISVGKLAEACLQRHGEEVLEIEINRRLLQEELKRNRTAVVQDDIDREVSRAASAFGITKRDGSADVARWLKMVTDEEGVTQSIYLSDVVWPTVALKKLVGNNVTVTDDDLQRGFEANYGERVECLAIVLSDQRRAAKVREEANKIDTNDNFGHLASVYSIEPISRNNHGRIPPIARFSGQPHVEAEAFKLQPGKISPVIVSHDRFIILRCLGRTKPVTTDPAAVRELLQEDLLEKKLRVEMAKTFEQIKQQAQIDNFLAKKTQPGRPRRVAARGTSGQPRARRPANGAGRVAPASATAPLRQR